MAVYEKLCDFKFKNGGIFYSIHPKRKAYRVRTERFTQQFFIDDSGGIDDYNKKLPEIIAAINAIYAAIW